MGKEVFREEIPRPYSSFINELEEENKKLKEDLAETQKIGESGRQECKQLKEDVDYRHHRAMVAERGGEDED